MSQLKKRQKQVKLQESKKTSSRKLEDEDEGINFRGFLKYFIIAALLVAVLMVIFSQVMEYQSRD